MFARGWGWGEVSVSTGERVRLGRWKVLGMRLVMDGTWEGRAMGEGAGMGARFQLALFTRGNGESAT